MSFRENSDGNLMGSGPDFNDPAGPHTVGLTIPTYIRDPKQAIMQSFAAAAYYAGTPGPNTGTLQGGSSGVGAWADAAPLGTLLGMESIAGASGSGGQKVETVMAHQSDVHIRGQIYVPLAIGMRAIGATDDGGGPTIDRNHALEVWEPQAGRDRWAIHSTGPARYQGGNAPGNLAEWRDQAGNLRLALSQNAAAFVGYGPDGKTVMFRADFSTGTLYARAFQTLA